MRLIDGDTLLRELEEANILSFYELNEHSNEAYKEFKALIEHAPTIEPERKPGKWISVFDEDEDRCSECQTTFFCAMTRFNFCPNCGADMRGEQDV